MFEFLFKYDREYKAYPEFGVFVVEDNKKELSVLDWNGKEIVACGKYESIDDFTCGYAHAIRARGLHNNTYLNYGDQFHVYIDTLGREKLVVSRKVFEKMYDCIDDTIVVENQKYGIFCAMKDGRCGCISKDGNTVLPFLFDGTDVFYDKIIAKKDDKFSILDSNLNVIDVYDNVICEESLLLSVVKDGKIGVIDKDNNIIIPIDYDDLNIFKNGVIALNKNKKWGFVNLNNKFSTPFIYDGIINSNGNYVFALKDLKCGALDLFGNTVIPFNYNYGHVSEDGLFYVKNDKNGDYFYIDREQNVYDSLEVKWIKKYFVEENLIKEKAISDLNSTCSKNVMQYIVNRAKDNIDIVRSNFEQRGGTFAEKFLRSCNKDTCNSNENC